MIVASCTERLADSWAVPALVLVRVGVLWKVQVDEMVVCCCA